MNCINCGKVLSNRQKKYCNNQCQAQYQRKMYIERWHQGIETGMSGEYGLSSCVHRYLLEKVNYQCEICGWGQTNPYTNTIPLEVHHKDGDYTNNIESNLQVLCPNCHSLTFNYKNASLCGRQGRKKYYANPELDKRQV